MAAIITISDYFGQQYSVLTSSYSNLVITSILVAFSVIVLVKHGIKGNFGKAWICFATFVVLWFVAERIWMVDELVYGADPWPSTADAFWIAAYPIYLAFSAFYLHPFKKLISSKLLALVFGSIVILGVLLVHHVTLQQSSLDYYEMLLAISYPVLDAFLLAPIAIGLVLFVRGQVNFVWSCLMFGMLSFVIADYGFLILSLDDAYRTGHPIDIPYLWGYLFLLFGVVNYLLIFRKQNLVNRFEDQDKFR